MLRWLLRIPGYLLRLTALIGIAGMSLGHMATTVSPDEWLFPAFFGLTYPLWLLLCVIGLFYALGRRRWWWFGATVVALMLSYQHIGNTLGLKFIDTSDENTDTKLAVTSYNVRLFDLYNWSTGSETKDEIFNFLSDVNSGVYCFQEFYYTGRKGVFDTRDTLMQLLDCGYIQEKYTHEMNGQQYFGVVTMSKYPIVARGEIAFDSDANNFCIYSDVVVGSDTVRVYNGHLSSIRFQKEDYSAIDSGPNRADAERLWGRLGIAFERRSSQLRILRKSVNDSPYPVIFCGDLNDTPVSFAYAQMSEVLADASQGHIRGFGGTHIGLLPFLRIDYIFHSVEMRVDDFTLHRDVELSDHHPLTAYFSW